MLNTELKLLLQVHFINEQKKMEYYIDRIFGKPSVKMVD